MKRLKISRSWLEKANFYTGLILAFCIPLFEKYLPYIIVIWVLTWLSEGNFKSKFERRLGDKRIKYGFILIISFYFLHLFGLIYSNNLDAGLFDVQVKLSILLLPIIIFFSNEIFNKKYNWILLSFLIGTILATLLCYSNALINSISLEEGIIIFNPIPKNEYWNNFFLYHYFSFLHHPSYFSMLLVFSISILFYYVQSKFFENRLKILLWVLIVYLSASVFLVSSRAGIICWFLVIIIFFLQKIREKSTFLKKLYLFIPVIICISLFVFAILYGVRFQSIKKQLWQNGTHTENLEPGNTVTRILIWEVTLDLIKKNFLFGVGTGDIKKELISKYDSTAMINAKSKNLNVHNQFLETFLGQGLIGIILLFSLFLVPLIYKKSYSHYLFPFFLLIIVSQFFFESMLNRLLGVVFFSYFYSLLLFVKPEEKE